MSLRVRLLLSFAYVLLLMLVALEIPLGLSLSRRVNTEIRAQAKAQAALVAADAVAQLRHPAALRHIATRASAQTGGRVLILAPNGRLLADSAGAGLLGSSYANRPEVVRALRGTTAQGIRNSQSLHQQLLFTAIPISSAGRTIGAVRVTQAVDEVSHAVRSDTIALAAVGAIALLLGLIVAWALASSLSRPLRNLATTARRVAGGELSARATVDGAREQQAVAAAFNEMTDRLVEALRAQRDFVANAAHQLRTPLTALQLRVEAGAHKAADPAAAEELRAAENEIIRLNRLISDLLILAGQTERPVQAVPVDLAQVARDAYQRWRTAAARSGHHLRVLESKSLLVAATPEDLATAIDNLIDNAIKHTSPGTEIELAWRADHTVGALGVIDYGDGISRDERHRVLERFYRGGAARQRGVPGTGLGLAIVQRIAHRFKGSLELNPGPQNGTRAEIRLRIWAHPLPDASDPVHKP